MKRFKTYIVEYLTDEQRDRYKDVHMSDKARSDTDHFFGVGNDAVPGEIKNDDKSEIHKQLENHLGQAISHEDYKRGAIKDKYNRDVKLGRLIKDNDLRNQFDKDHSRASRTNFTTSTVRGTEVAGQTNLAKNPEHPKGQSWGDISCKNIDDGINRHYLKHEIKHGTVVHFVKDHNGQEIYRATLQPHHNEHGDVAYAVDAEYGIKHPKFTADAHRVAGELSGEYKPGTFRKHHEVYNDNGRTEITHPKLSDGHITDILTHGSYQDKSRIIDHPALTSDHITKILHYESDPSLRAHALLRDDLTTPAHITKALDDPNDGVRRVAINNTANITPNHISRALQSDMPDDIRKTAAKSPHADSKMISHVIQHDPSGAVVKAALDNKNATAEHITLAQQHPNSDIRAHALTKDHLINDTHLHNAIGDPNSYVSGVAASHSRIKPEHIDHILKYGSVRDIGTVLNSSAAVTPEHIKTVMHSDDPRFTPSVKRYAALHPNASHENIMDALKTGDPDLQHDILENHHNLGKEHLDYLLKHTHDGDENLAAISRHPSLHPEHITSILNRPKLSKNLFAQRIKQQLASHPNLTPEHMEHLTKADDNTTRIRRTIVTRSDVPTHVLSHVIRHDPDEVTREYAIKHHNAQPDDLDYAVKNDPTIWNKEAALRNNNTPISTIKHIADTHNYGSLWSAAKTELRHRGVQSQ